MKKIITLFLFLLIFSFANSQIEKKGTIKVKKSNCYDVKLNLALIVGRDSITISEVNKSFGFIAFIKNCSEEGKYLIESYDIIINQAPKKHLTQPVVPANSFKIQKEGILSVTDCIIRIVRENKKDTTIVLPTQIFNIIADK